MSGSLALALGTGTLSAAILGWWGAAQLVRWVEFSKPIARPFLPKTTLNQDQKILLGGLIPALLVALLVDFFLAFFLMLATVGLWWFRQKAPQWKSQRTIQKRQEKMASIFPQALGMAIQALKTGQTIPQVLDYLSRETPPPLREELGLVCSEMNLGSSAEQALAKMGDRYPRFSEFHQFVESYRISRQTGANLTHLLQVLVEGMEEKNRILRKMDAMTAQARLSGLMIGSLPFLLATVFFVMDPNLILPLFTQKTGWSLLALAAVLETIGFAWISQLLRLEV